MSKKYKLIILCLLILLLSSVLIWNIVNDREPKVMFHDDFTGIQFQYNARLTSYPLTEADKQEHILLRLGKDSDTDPIRITVAYENNLRTVAKATLTDSFSLISSNIGKTLPRSYPNYEQISSETTVLADHKTIKTIFRYHKDNEPLVQQQLIAILKDEDTAIYIRFQAPESSFSKQDAQYFKPIVESFKFL
jgi:hypothetical protein